MATTLTPVKGKGGVVRYVAAPPAALEERDRAIAALQVEVLRGRAANTHLQDQLAATHAAIHGLKSEVRGLRAALSSSLAGPAGTRWRATICDECGCLVKPHETCPMCLWVEADTRRKEAA